MITFLWFEPPVKPSDNAPFFERQLYESALKTAEDYVNQKYEHYGKRCWRREILCD